jgi:leucine dehydrogenase
MIVLGNAAARDATPSCSWQKQPRPMESADMEVFKTLNGYNCRRLHLVYDRPSHLRAVIAIDSVVDGRAVGGIRNLEYATEQDAIDDACDLARAMSFKAALAGLPCGGAKTVIFRHPGMKRAAAYRALGAYIAELGGLYHTGSDLGTTKADLDDVAKATRHVSNRLDFGKHTAAGLVHAMRAAASFTGAGESLIGLKVAIQGLGEVGMELARRLHEEGAQLAVSDPITARASKAKKDFGAEIVEPERLLSEPCDILAPCAMGGLISSETLPTLGCSIIAGAANNQLTDSGVALELQKAGICYVPDFVASAGALIVGVTEIAGTGRADNGKLVERIHQTTLDVLKAARTKKTSTVQAAETMAAKRLKL